MRQALQPLALCYTNNKLSISTKKTREIIVEFRRIPGSTYIQIHTNQLEHISSFKFLGVHLSEDLSWSVNTTILVKKAYQRLFILRKLKKAHLSPQILVNFYRSTIESILVSCITVWYGTFSIANRKTLHQVEKTAQHITVLSLPTIKTVLSKMCLWRARSIARDRSHSGHRGSTLLPSSFTPSAVTLLKFTNM